MLQRPKAGETEEDLLKQEEEFLKQSGKAPTQKRDLKVKNDEAKSFAVSGIVGEVVERSQGLPYAPNRGDEAKGKGFPVLFKIDLKLAPNKKAKKSLFALHMEKNKTVSGNVTMEMGAPNLNAAVAGSSQGSDHKDTPKASGSNENRAPSGVVDKSIHEENLNKLSAMSEAEILEAQRILNETLDSKLVSLLKNRPKQNENADGDEEPQPLEAGVKTINNLTNNEKLRETLRDYIGDKWINMDVLENEKLEWVGEIPSEEALHAGQPYSARFNFKGELQPFRAEIDVRNALYHHGDEPERPGYTIQELYQLSRSSVLQQRILALNTLANIIYKAKLGYYDTCFDGFLLHKLIEADLFLLLRFSIDEKALIPAAMNCLRRLLYNDSDEYCLDRLLGTTEEDLQPLLFNKKDGEEEDSDEEGEMTDDTIIHTDLVKGAVRTDLLTRITYILNYLPCNRETVTNAILCFIRIARHSTDSCQRMAVTPNLLNFVYSTINCDNPIYQSVKLFRILMNQSRDLASQIATWFPCGFLVTFLNLETVKKIPKRELCLLKLECLYYIRNAIRGGIMKDDFTTYTPYFVRLLRFFADKVDIYAESDFDFELFTALMSLVRLCVCEKLPIDNHYVTMMYVCMEKWMNQLLQSQKFTYASMKALGCCFAFFVDYFEIFGSDGKSLAFIRKLNVLVTTLIYSPLFDRMAIRLTDYSHLLVATPINRDPSNLPALCSVYENGEDFLKIVNNQSTLPFFVYFVKYLEFSYEILNESRINVELFVNNTAIRKYVAEVMKLEKNSGNWFERYELGLLTDILLLFSAINDKDTLKLGFRLVPMFRVDDENMVLALGVVTDKEKWGSEDELFQYLPDIYLDLLYAAEMRHGYITRYINQTIGEDWAYKALTKARGRETALEATKILKFLTLVNSREPNLLKRIPYTVRYYHLCAVFLTDVNVFNKDVQGEMRTNFRCILDNRDELDLSKKMERRNSFFDLYTELITQYAGVSYGMHIFAELILLPLQNRFDVSYRKLIWFEYFHVLKVITIPYPSSEFIDVEEFVEPYETDESLLVAYLNSVSSNVISKQKNPFIYNLAVSNINNYMRNACPDSAPYNFLSRRIRFTISERVKRDLMSW